jgi:hypothetical protein
LLSPNNRKSSQQGDKNDQHKQNSANYSHEPRPRVRRILFDRISTIFN